ncbi:MAG: epoxyqueuosine reductase [Anaerolineae bacterium]|nr:epoxyqueuosine reductase [Anaerolineae bacterium]
MADRDMDKLTRFIKDVARQQGAMLVGVASIDRFEPLPPLYDAVPQGHHPRDFLPTARSVISIAMPILNPVLNAPAALADIDLEMVPEHVKYPYLEQLYNRVGHVVHDTMLEMIGQIVGQQLLAHGYQAMIFPTTGLHPKVDDLSDIEIWEGPPRGSPLRIRAKHYSPFRYTFGPFSHRHAATRAGLGEFGYNNVVLTPQFGPRQRFNSIITDADLLPDPLIDEPICLRDTCKLCLEACIMSCITLRDDQDVTDYRSVKQDDHRRIFIDTPAKTDPTLCRRRREGKPHSPVRGDCIRVCPIPTMPKRLPERLQDIVARWQSG